jgi:hypothetical protein
MNNGIEQRIINALAKSLAGRWPVGLTWDQLERVRRLALSLAAAPGSLGLSTRAVKAMQSATGGAVDGRRGILELLRIIPKSHRRAPRMILAVRAFVVALGEVVGPAECDDGVLEEWLASP